MTYHPRMAYEYSDPKHATDKYTMPNIEVFYAERGELQFTDSDDDTPSEAGYYWWTCVPGCMPDSDPDGPYATYDEALQAARDEYAEWDDNEE